MAMDKQAMSEAFLMAESLYEIFMDSTDPEIIRLAAMPLFNTEVGKAYISQNPVTL